MLVARFIPTLDLRYESGLTARLLHLAETAREAQPSDSPWPTSSAQTNLPALLTRFIGRTREMEEVQRLLKTTRLLTLVGTGGAGKTRLALEVGVAVGPLFADGVWLMELAALTEAAGVPARLAAMFGLPAEAGRPLEAALYRQVGDQDMLANPLGNLGRLALERGDDVQARTTLAECLPIFGEIGDGEALADGLIIGALLAHATRQTHRAVVLLAAANALLENSDWQHRVVDSSGYADYERCHTAARAQLNAATFEAAWAEGRALTVAQAIEQAVAQP